MNDHSYLHITLIYLAVINVVTFFMYGIDKWKAMNSKWRIRQHKKFKYGLPLILLAQIVLMYLISEK